VQASRTQRAEDDYTANAATARRSHKDHVCLTELLDDLSKLESFETAWGFARDLQSNRPLETAEARKKREEAEAEEYFALFEAPEQKS
jgi:hypothetical protein